ncbi:9542_t:CDS:1, partial [Gigaspora rosea]
MEQKNMLLEEFKIRESIEERCDRIVMNQKLMLNSILETLTKKIKIDRVCEDVGNDFKLYSEEKEVLNQVEIYFKEQFRKRNFDVRNLKQEWQEQYKLKENIKEE